MARRTELSSLESHLGYWIRYVSNHVSHAFALKLAAVGVTVAEWVVLRDLYDSENAPSAARRPTRHDTRGDLEARRPADRQRS